MVTFADLHKLSEHCWAFSIDASVLDTKLINNTVLMLNFLLYQLFSLSLNVNINKNHPNILGTYTIFL